jgi:hypothetical protein
MEKRSKHPMDVLRWIETVIDSCKTYEQTKTAYILINKCYKDTCMGGEEFYSLFQEYVRVKKLIIIKQLELSNKI